MKEVTTKCINGHLNPSDALYCGVCGAQISSDDSGFTPDLYPGVHLVPISVKKIRFIQSGEVFSWIVLPIIIIVGGILLEVFQIEIMDFIHDDEESFIGIAIVATIPIAMLFYGACRGFVHLVNKIEYKVNADYIEETTYELVRIAKLGKLGLFNQKKKKLLLAPQYDKIEKFDSKHVLIGNNRFIGLYSIPFKRIIIPVECDAINPEKDGVFEVTASGVIRHYDILGNILH